MPGIKYFILGSLTAFNDGERGADGGVGIGGLKLSGGKKVASLTIHLRMIDATNGQVVYSKPVSGTVEVVKGGISIAGFGDFGAFMASPVGQAIRKCWIELQMTLLQRASRVLPPRYQARSANKRGLGTKANSVDSSNHSHEERISHADCERAVVIVIVTAQIH